MTSDINSPSTAPDPIPTGSGAGANRSIRGDRNKTASNMNKAASNKSASDRTYAQSRKPLGNPIAVPATIDRPKPQANRFAHIYAQGRKHIFFLDRARPQAYKLIKAASTKHQTSSGKERERIPSPPSPWGRGRLQPPKSPETP